MKLRNPHTPSRQPVTQRSAMELIARRGMAKFIVVIVVVFLAIGHSPAQVPEDLSKLDIATLQQRASSDNADAEYELGLRNQFGTGVPLNYGAAEYWYTRAGTHKSLAAQIRLAHIYSDGLGEVVYRNEYKAAIWFRAAAEQGDRNSQVSLATLYRLGKGVPQDDAQARLWFQKAADQGDKVAKANLAFSDREGHSTNKSTVPQFAPISKEGGFKGQVQQL
jgi:uncharacterized protein